MKTQFHQTPFPDEESTSFSEICGFILNAPSSGDGTGRKWEENDLTGGGVRRHALDVNRNLNLNLLLGALAGVAVGF
jgi:hypothetical protein